MSNNGTVLRIAGLAKLGKISSHFIAGQCDETEHAYARLLQHCSGDYQKLRQIHAHLLVNGYRHHTFLQTKLCTLYAELSIGDARLLFDGLRRPRKLCLWNVLCREYARNHSSCREAVTLYRSLASEGLCADNYTLPYAIKAAGSLLDLKLGIQIQSNAIVLGFAEDEFVVSSLIAMYAKCKAVEDARKVFDRVPRRNLIAWNAILAGYAQNGRSCEALQIFCCMQDRDLVSMKCILPACANLCDLPHGKQIHCYMIKRGFDADVEAATSLVNMYAVCRELKIAARVFDRIPIKDAAAWNAFMAACAEKGKPQAALMLFLQMFGSYHCRPDLASAKTLLSAIAELAFLDTGMNLHVFILKSGFGAHVSVGTALVDMYAKCGALDMAQKCFDEMNWKDTVSWSALIGGYGSHGLAESAIDIFQRMRETGMIPDGITFLCLLSACSYAGLVDQGWYFFQMMVKDYQIVPMVEHYTCMVDLLGRAGCLYEAETLIENMSRKPDAGVYGALLGACRIHSNVELGARVAEKLFQLDPENSGHYILLSNIYAAARRLDDVARVRAWIKEQGLKVPAGCSTVEINHKLHSFIANDKSHPESYEIYRVLQCISGKMKETGYVPDTSLVLRQVAEESKEQVLWSHSEKLAIALSIISKDDRSTIRITKNLRTCLDCHLFAKHVSVAYNREIIVRDSVRFHRFKDGLCSCGDYW